jgi:hypothetical protein
VTLASGLKVKLTSVKLPFFSFATQKFVEWLFMFKLCFKSLLTTDVRKMLPPAHSKCYTLRSGGNCSVLAPLAIVNWKGYLHDNEQNAYLSPSLAEDPSSNREALVFTLPFETRQSVNSIPGSVVQQVKSISHSF